jgi:hypothetical protein
MFELDAGRGSLERGTSSFGGLARLVVLPAAWRETMMIGTIGACGQLFGARPLDGKRRTAVDVTLEYCAL